jgi:hypothetical protein
MRRPGAIFAGLFLLGVALGCAPRRPPFVEPDWGDAPPPYPSEVTEITREFRHCAQQCRFDRLVIRRDGEVTRRFSTAGRIDSILTARIDSVSFVRLVIALDSTGLFAPMVGAGEQIPLAVDSYLISAATLCRRAVATWSPLADAGWTPGSHAVLEIERALLLLRWRPPNAGVYQMSRAS